MNTAAARRALELTKTFRESVEALVAIGLEGDEPAAVELVLERVEDLTAAVAVLLEALDKRRGLVDLGPVSPN